MNIALFIHGKASAGKDQFVKGLKVQYHYLYTSEFPKHCFSKEEWKELRNFVSGKPAIFDTPDIVCLPFADEVRRELCRIDPGIDFNRLCQDYEYKSRFRKELIKIGDGYRQENPGIWVEKHYTTLKQWNADNNGKIICVPDMRYHTENQGSEYDYSREVCEWGKIVSFRIKIHAPLGIRLLRMSSNNVGSYLKYGVNNPSETSMEELPDRAFDYVCDNSENVSNCFPDSFRKPYWDIMNLFLKIKNEQ